MKNDRSIRSFWMQHSLLGCGGDEENSVCFAFCCSYDRIFVRCPYDRPSAYKTVHRTVLLYGVSLRSSILCIKKQHIPLVCTVLLVEMRLHLWLSRPKYIGFPCCPGSDTPDSLDYHSSNIFVIFKLFTITITIYSYYVFVGLTLS